MVNESSIAISVPFVESGAESKAGVVNTAL
jgi:hypothetical protein